MPFIKRNSKYAAWYKEIEKSLWRFFSLFENLCTLCYQQTISQIEDGGQRHGRVYWCCCLIDNQVHDYWESLNAMQQKIGGPHWYEKIKTIHDIWRKEITKRRFPGNGPCTAFGYNGCLLKRYRPVTCNTQLCEKMLLVLTKLKLIQVDWNKPLQIEDLIVLPKIPKILYGLEVGHVKSEQVEVYLKTVKKLRDRLSKKESSKRQDIVREALTYFLGKGG